MNVLLQHFGILGLYVWLVSNLPPTFAVIWTGTNNWGLNQIPLIESQLLRDKQRDTPAYKRDHVFTLRHIFHHKVYDDTRVFRRDIEDLSEEYYPSHEQQTEHKVGPFFAKSSLIPISRLSNRTVDAAKSRYKNSRLTGGPTILTSDEWRLETTTGPNITDKQTVISLAQMSWNAYTEKPGSTDWQDLKDTPFNHSRGFGWDSDGLRGHVFADESNSTVVIALKGTSPSVFDGAETTTNDKINDNLFFACCCGQGGQFLWHQVCDCMTSAFTCNSTCVVSALRNENRYYSSSIELYGNVTSMYPDAEIWMVGHSLGGSTSALLGLTFGISVTTFEAPGEALAAARLGLPSPPEAIIGAPQTRKFSGINHFGHTADPIFMGSCNAATSACTLGGYAMQTQCHTGMICTYDTVRDKNWRVGAGYHRISNVIHDVLEDYPEVAKCIPDSECVDCFNWKYFESNHSTTITSTTKYSTQTSTRPTTSKRTTTCQTPGWWGCLDESTTMQSTSTISPSKSTSLSTSCVHYGWFGGCLETTTFRMTSSQPSSTSTSERSVTTTEVRPVATQSSK